MRAWAELYQIWEKHRAIVGAHQVCCRFQLSCSMSKRGWLKDNWGGKLRQISHQWRTGPPGNREISRWAPASGFFSGPPSRPYVRIYFIDNQLTQSADRLSIHRAGGKTPVPPGRGPHVCSGASCYVCEKFSGRVHCRCMTVVVL